jgi:hypothetical protein
MAKKVAVLIGIDYYAYPDIQLRGSINDTVNMRNMLIDAYGYDPANIIMLRDDMPGGSSKPTASNITSTLNKVVVQSANLQELWIHYSGHGSQINDNNNVGFNSTRNKVDDVLVPCDYRTGGYITDLFLLNLIKNIKCRAVLLFDCCHSGTVCDLPWTIMYNSPTSFSRIAINQQVLANPNIVMFSGCKDSQTSADTYSALEAQGVGAFTDAFLECLRKNGHNVSFMILYRDICSYLAANGYTQVPLLSSSTSMPVGGLYRTTTVTANPADNVIISNSSATITLKAAMKSIMNL